MTSEEAIPILHDLFNYYNDKENDSYVGFDKEDNEAIRMAIKALEHTKNEEPAYWYKKGIYPGWLYCSNCGEPWSFNTGAPPYCPCCGTRMVEPQESEDKE